MAGARTLHIMSYQNDNHETIHPFEERSAGSAQSEIAEQLMLTRYTYVITNKATVPLTTVRLVASRSSPTQPKNNIHKLKPNAWSTTMLVFNKLREHALRGSVLVQGSKYAPRRKHMQSTPSKRVLKPKAVALCFVHDNCQRPMSRFRTAATRDGGA
jgi:hypothetical protein